MKRKNIIGKVFFIISFLVVSLSPLMAQVAADPNDSFYVDALRWELQGLIPNLPEIRPYSLQLVKSILETVMGSDDEIAANEAKIYYDRYFGRAIRVGLETGFYGEISEDFEKQLDINPVIYGNAEVLENTTVSFEATPLLSTGIAGQEIKKKYSAPKYDSISDNLEVSKFNLYTPYNAVAAYGTDEIYFQAGLNRNSYGNILDTGIVVGATSPHVGSFVFTINKEKFNYQLATFLLSASTSSGKGSYPTKYYYFHSLRYSFTDKFDFSVYESAISGPDFGLRYLMPIVPFMAIQQVSGVSNDNLLLGFQISYKPTNGVKIFGNIMADDIGFNDLVKLKFDTKLKMAVEAGIQYVPTGNSLCKIFSVDYTFLAPYMYTHAMYDAKNKTLPMSEPNFQNYTNGKVSFGSTISPNSDRIRFSLQLQPAKNLKIDIGSFVVRHGNINETYFKKAIKNGKVVNYDAYNCLEQYLTSDYGSLTDGSIFDFPNAGNGYFNYPNHNFLFLDNTTNYVCYLNEVGANYSFNFKNKSYLVCGLEYAFQFEHNVGVENQMFSADSSLKNASEDEIIKVLNNQYNQWKANLRDKLTNYLTLSIKYIY